jgi:sec-independent protein translocase protein TatB
MKRMSFSETIFLFFLALIIFGPKKLPEIARQVGKWMNEFRRASNEFKSQIEQEIAHLDVESNKQTILPPSPPVEGTTSRTLNAANDVEAEPKPAETPEPAATLAATESESSSTATEAGATEAVTPAETVTTGSPQESHG